MEHALRMVTEALNFTDCFTHHFKGVFRVDLIDRQAGIADKKGWSELIEVIASAAMPVYSFANPTLLSIDDLIHTHFTMSISMITHFDAYPSPSHFVGNGSSSARTKEGVQYKIARVRGECQNTCNQSFWLRCSKRRIAEQSKYFLFCFISMTDILMHK